MPEIVSYRLPNDTEQFANLFVCPKLLSSYRPYMLSDNLQLSLIMKCMYTYVDVLTNLILTTNITVNATWD